MTNKRESSIPENATRVQTFRNQPQYGDQEFAWEPENRFFSGNIQQNAPGYLTELFGRLDRQRSGQLQPWEAEELGQWEATARAMPTRDIGSLTAGWQGETGSEGWWTQLDPGSPDAGGVMLALAIRRRRARRPRRSGRCMSKCGAWRRTGTTALSAPGE